MSTEKKITCEVLIVGAGPSGLMLACQLALQNIPFRIIEKRSHRKIYSGALIIQARTLEILNQMGIADTFINAGIIPKHVKIKVNGKNRTQLPIEKIGVGYSEFPYLLCIINIFMKLIFYKYDLTCLLYLPK